jgi:hypothetical protein
MDFANFYAKNGISPFNALDAIRPYGYPYFVSLIIRANIFGLPIKLFLFVVQLSLYIILATQLAREVYKSVSPKIGDCIFFGLIGNIFIYPFLAIPLTDGFIVIILLAIACLVVRIFDGYKNYYNFRWMVFQYFAIGLLAAYTIVTRPAFVFIALPITFFMFIHVRYYGKNKIGSIAIGLTVFLLGILVAMSPEILLNLSNFSKLSFLPVDHQDAFFGTARKLLKCQTNLSGGYGVMCSKNPWYVQDIYSGFDWYLNHPLLGVNTLLIHLYGALDYNFLFPYVYNLNISYRPALFLLSQFSIYWGFVGLYYSLRVFTNREKDMSSVDNRCYLILLFSFLFGWASVHALVPNDPRYSLSIEAILIPFALHSIIKHADYKKHKLIFGGFILYLLFAYYLSQLISENIFLFPTINDV